MKAAALELGLPVTDRVADVVEAGVDLGVVVAFGRIIPAAVLERVPMVNLHFSLLPRWRGAAPVERAILAGDDRTGVDLMAVEEGLDTGGIYRRAEVAIGPDDDLEALRGRLVEVGTGLLVDALRDGLGSARPQEGEPTYAAKVEPHEREIDWSAPGRRRPPAGAGRRGLDHPRGQAPQGPRHPRAARSATGRSVPAGDGPVELVEVQPEGKGRMAASAWANGARWQPGDRLPS